jgi:DEAD/DEAH box helicase domain-containing protein
MSLENLLDKWKADPEITDNITVWHTIHAREPIWEPIPDDIHPTLRVLLDNIGIHQLYAHQAAAWRTVNAGNHMVVVTGTSSGKTLCYNLPVLDRLLKEPDSHALYLYPTKALAQDQENSLRHMMCASMQGSIGTEPTTISAEIYDGDTPSHSRSSIRSSARLILTNPDMLHAAILPHHTVWAKFFRTLRFVVLDEMHVYRGVFGSHVSNVVRRLKRIARFYGSNPQFILTSATIANPEELAKSLIEPETTNADITLLADDGSALGQKTFVIYNPPVVNKELGLRRSPFQDSIRLASDLLAYNVQTILFARSRRSVELILSSLRQQIPSHLQTTGIYTLGTNSSNETIRGYRSGYLPKQRRAIERGLRHGEIKAVVATNALELGIDIGKLGAAILVGYPGTITATWQQAGRAGRSEKASLAVMVAGSDPLDQFLASHPEYFFNRTPEHAYLDPDNPLILLSHIRCAAFELPFRKGEGFGKIDSTHLVEFLDFLTDEGYTHKSNGSYFWVANQYPSQLTALRSTSPENIILQVDDDKQTIIGQVDWTSAFWMVHPQAIYLHEALLYRVDDLNLEQKIARLQQSDSDYYTEPRIDSKVQLSNLFQATKVTGCSIFYGEILVTTTVIGFRKIKWLTHEQIGVGEVDLPPTELLTTGYWFSLDQDIVDNLRERGLWNNDPNEYGPNWSIQRDRARARDAYKCQVCGDAEQERSHDVHHIIPFRSFSTYIQANKLENLTTLCTNCHRRAESAVRVRSGLAGLSFTLGHLAPLFVMCDISDLGVHSDPMSQLTGGKPTVVFYDQVPAGIGLSKHLYDLHDEFLASALELVESCACNDGCPSCVGPGGENGLGSKRETLAILHSLLHQMIS